MLKPEWLSGDELIKVLNRMLRERDVDGDFRNCQFTSVQWQDPSNDDGGCNWYVGFGFHCEDRAPASVFSMVGIIEREAGERYRLKE